MLEGQNYMFLPKSKQSLSQTVIFKERDLQNKVYRYGTLEILTFKETLTEQSGQSSFPQQNNLPLNKQ